MLLQHTTRHKERPVAYTSTTKHEKKTVHTLGRTMYRLRLALRSRYAAPVRSELRIAAAIDAVTAVQPTLPMNMDAMFTHTSPIF